MLQFRIVVGERHSSQSTPWTTCALDVADHFTALKAIFDDHTPIQIVNDRNEDFVWFDAESFVSEWAVKGDDMVPRFW